MDEPPDFAFDLDRSTAQAWDQFAERLAEVVSVIDDDGELTISTLSARTDTAPLYASCKMILVAATIPR